MWISNTEKKPTSKLYRKAFQQTCPYSFLFPLIYRQYLTNFPQSGFMIHHTQVISVLLFCFSILVFTSVSVGDGMASDEKNDLKIDTGSSVAELMQPWVQAIKSDLKLTQLHLSHLYKPPV